MILDKYVDGVLDTLLNYMGRNWCETADIDTREIYRAELSESYMFLCRIRNMPHFIVVEYWDSIISKYRSIFVAQWSDKNAEKQNKIKQNKTK